MTWSYQLILIMKNLYSNIFSGTYGGLRLLDGKRVSYFRYLCVFSLLFSVGKPSSCELLPTVLWDPFSPLFNETKCGRANHLQVKVNDIINFVCPSRGLSNVMISNIRNFGDMYENLWFTDNNESARNCNASSAQYLLGCNQPSTLLYYGCSFREKFHPPSFIAGKTYYFFGTGDGSKQGLNNKQGGRCKTHNMIVSVYICHMHEVCNRTEMYSCNTIKAPEVRYVPVPVSGRRIDENIISNVGNGIVIPLLLCLFFFGVAVGLVLRKASERMKRKRFNCEQPGSGAESSTKSFYLESEGNGNCLMNDTHCVLENDGEVKKIKIVIS